MRHLLIILAVAIASTAAYAACTTSSVVQPDGRVTICSTCCDANGNCNVVCTPN